MLAQGAYVPIALSDRDVERLRAGTPGCTERIHLHNVGAALMPKAVSDAIVSHIELESQIGGYEAAAARAEAVEQAYHRAAHLVGCHARNLAFVENATVAYAQALSSMPFETGDLILTSTNDYISNQIMFLSLARRFGLEIVRAPNHPAGGVDAVATAPLLRQRRPKLVALTHVPTNSGLIQPVEEVGQVCRELGVWYLVDACQSVGQLPLDVKAVGCDSLTATSRKFLREPRGAGLLFVFDRALQAGLAPLFVDMGGAEWVDGNKYVVNQTAKWSGNWEFPYALILGTAEAARYATTIGLEAICERTTALAASLRRKLREVAELRVLDHGPRLAGIVTVAIPGWEPEAFHRELEQRGINSSMSLRGYAVIDFDEKGVKWALRLSPHYYNTEEEPNQAVAAVSELARGRPR